MPGDGEGVAVGCCGTATGPDGGPSDIGSPLPHLLECIYLDYNATTPIYPEVQAAMLPFTLEQARKPAGAGAGGGLGRPFPAGLFGNPSSGHVYGRRAAAAVAAARISVAALIGCSADEVFFTSCGTESDAWAIWGAVAAARRRAGPTGAGKLPHVVTSAIEHPAVAECLRALAEQGLCAFTTVGVNSEGLVNPDDVKAALTPETVLVSIMHSNNEVGSIQAITEIAAAIHGSGVLLHSDAAQSLGKVPVDVEALGVDLLTVVGHKFGAPKGVGALYIRRGVELAPLLRGGGQERGARAGTESTLLIAGLGAAAEVARRDLDAAAAHLAAARDELQALLLAAFGGDGRVRVNGPADGSRRLPNTLSISVCGLRAGALLSELSDCLAASAAAACHSGASAVSPVLRALGVQPKYAAGTLRLSTGRFTAMAEVRRAAELIVAAAARQGVPVHAATGAEGAE